MARYKAMEAFVPIEKGQGVYSPEVKGKKKYGPLDWSLDELIAYRENGTSPARIPDKEILYKLGALGVSLSNTCDLFAISKDKFCSNLDWLENWQRGRAECGTRIRASIVEDALEKDNLMAKIHLDKIFSGEGKDNGPLVQVNVSTGLENVNTNDLLNVMYVEDGNEDDTSQ